MTYKVPKHDAIQVPVETPNKATASTAPAVPSRMLAALIIDGETAWSFKSLAPTADYPSDAKGQFDLLIKSLKFESPAKPTWELGDNWTEQPGSGMRTANLMLGGIEFSVIKLPFRSPNKNNYVLGNINRWRGQLGISDISLADLETNTEEIATSDGHSATVIDIEGKSSGNSMAPMAGGAPMRSAPQTRPQTRPSNASPPFTGEAPEDWQSLPPRPMQLAQFETKTGDAAAKISVSRAGGDVLMNLNRWRGQVSLEPAKQMGDLQTDEIEVSGQAGILAEIYGEKGQSIVVAMVPSDSPTWFFKLMGDTEAVKAQAESFKDYLNTITIK